MGLSFQHGIIDVFFFPVDFADLVSFAEGDFGYGLVLIGIFLLLWLVLFPFFKNRKEHTA